jgi:hypothetical protein
MVAKVVPAEDVGAERGEPPADRVPDPGAAADPGDQRDPAVQR